MRLFASKASLAVLAVIAAGVPSAAFAHAGHSHAGFADGMMHPFTGLDHVLAMVAVGLWAAQIGGRALWLLPLTFPAMMAAGATLGIGGVPLPWVEAGITASVIVLGAAVALAFRPSFAVSVPLIAVFAVLHGYSHGVELPADGSALAYGAGFIASTLSLHAMGICLGFAAARVPIPLAARSAGGVISALGVVLLVMPH